MRDFVFSLLFASGLARYSLDEYSESAVDDLLLRFLGVAREHFIHQWIKHAKLVDLSSLHCRVWHRDSFDVAQYAHICVVCSDLDCILIIPRVRASNVDHLSAKERLHQPGAGENCENGRVLRGDVDGVSKGVNYFDSIHCDFPHVAVLHGGANDLHLLLRHEAVSHALDRLYGRSPVFHMWSRCRVLRRWQYCDHRDRVNGESEKNQVEPAESRVSESVMLMKNDQ